MDEQEYDLTVPANRGDLINVIEAVTPKADVHLTASIGRNRPKADVKQDYVTGGYLRFIAQQAMQISHYDW